MNKMDPIKQFQSERNERITSYSHDKEFKSISYEWLKESFRKKFEYNFEWLGRPIIQYPMDMLAVQEIIWKTGPDLIIETGIAHGGSLIFSASMLEIIGSGEVLGIDIDIREHNRKKIEQHHMYKRITMIEGPSTDKDVVDQVKEFAKNKSRVLLLLDSNHTHDHVLKELEYYSPLVSVDSYIIVFDTFVEDLPDEFFSDKPWGKGNNPKTAVWQFLKNNDQFEIDKEIENKLMVTSAPDGFLRRIK